eukprot:1194884-Prorocentrum_minimum.AAC.13
MSLDEDDKEMCDSHISWKKRLRLPEYRLSCLPLPKSVSANLVNETPPTPASTRVPQHFANGHDSYSLAPMLTWRGGACLARQAEFFRSQLDCCIEAAFVGNPVLTPLGTPETLLVDDVDVTDSDSDDPPAHKWLISGSVAGIVCLALLVGGPVLHRGCTLLYGDRPVLHRLEPGGAKWGSTRGSTGGSKGKSSSDSFYDGQSRNGLARPSRPCAFAVSVSSPVGLSNLDDAPARANALGAQVLGAQRRALLRAPSVSRSVPCFSLLLIRVTFAISASACGGAVCGGVGLPAVARSRAHARGGPGGAFQVDAAPAPGTPGPPRGGQGGERRAGAGALRPLRGAAQRAGWAAGLGRRLAGARY